MRISIFIAAAMFVLVAAASSALAGTIKLQATMGQVDIACIDSGGTITAGKGPGGFGCKTAKGEISCDKEGKCEGTCAACGSRVTSKSTRLGRVGGILGTLGGTDQPSGSGTDQPAAIIDGGPLLLQGK